MLGENRICIPSATGSRVRPSINDVGRYVIIGELLEIICNILPVFIRQWGIQTYAGFLFHKVVCTRYDVTLYVTWMHSIFCRCQATERGAVIKCTKKFEETQGRRCGCKRDNRTEGWEEVRGET
jgi:hypothetical protein